MRSFPSLRKQLGFLFLTTGANGAGKTLFTLADVRKLQVETSRPVFFHGFTAKQPLLDFGWREFEPEQWQDCPDGSILVMDECHLKMPLRGTGKPPEWIEMIPVTHRKRGMDIFLITQHPMNMDAFIRRVIASPGWHRHFKASFMGDSSNELKWASVNDQPQKPGSGKTGEITSRAFPREVYSWYESASIHTAKKSIPKKVWIGLGALLLAIASVVAVVKILSMQAGGAVAEKSSLSGQAKAAAGSGGSVVSAPARTRADGPAQALTTAEYLEQRTPRITGFPHTSPAYDSVTQPTQAPYPAACVQMGDKCKCYSQQATLLQVADSTCRQIVTQGFFMDWKQPEQPQQRQEDRRGRVMTSAPPSGAVVVAQAPQSLPAPPPSSAWSEGLAARNAQVKSSLER